MPSLQQRGWPETATPTGLIEYLHSFAGVPVAGKQSVLQTYNSYEVARYGVARQHRLLGVQSSTTTILIVLSSKALISLRRTFCGPLVATFLNDECR